MGDGKKGSSASRDEFEESYRDALRDLTFNSKDIINALTMLASENAAEHAASVVRAVVHAVGAEVAVARKMPYLYLMDSIVKNVSNPYAGMFRPHAADVFRDVWNAAAKDSAVRGSLQRLLATWRDMEYVQIANELDALTRPQPQQPQTATSMSSSASSSHPSATRGIRVNAAVLSTNSANKPPLDAAASAPVAFPGGGGGADDVASVRRTLAQSEEALRDVELQLSRTTSREEREQLKGRIVKLTEMIRHVRALAPPAALLPAPAMQAPVVPASDIGRLLDMIAAPSNPAPGMHGPIQPQQQAYWPMHPPPQPPQPQPHPHVMYPPQPMYPYGAPAPMAMPPHPAAVGGPAFAQRMAAPPMPSGAPPPRPAPLPSSIPTPGNLRRGADLSALFIRSKKPRKDPVPEPSKRARGGASGGGGGGGGNPLVPADVGGPVVARIIRELYDGQPVQCVQCGLRFRSQDEGSVYVQHLDWHYRQNTRGDRSRLKAGVRSREWFAAIDTWLVWEDPSLTAAPTPGSIVNPLLVVDEQPAVGDGEAAASHGGGGHAGGGSVREPSGGNTFVALNDDEQEPRCVVCGDALSTEYEHASENWVVRGAVRTASGQLCHRECAGL